ncbi:caspase-2-like [Cyprinodon tularosa]|uniref:caspase-2-like n=1 Tax=Cyprinodon tularosa TaxID=77115 RepID=UPI0018E27D9F|nr:caspase-2-like [Cyprinodon tularosa]
MRLLSFGSCADRAVGDVLLGLHDLRMFGSGTKKWFVKKQKKQQKSGKRPCSRKRKRWAAKILKEHREQILRELDVSAVLPYLVYDKVFSLVEYKEILGQETSRGRAEVFLNHLSSKGPAAFSSFCSVLEEVCPRLLTCFLLDGEDGVPVRSRKAWLSAPPNSPAEQPLCPPPMYTDPVFDTR